MSIDAALSRAGSHFIVSLLKLFGFVGHGILCFYTFCLVFVRFISVLLVEIETSLAGTRGWLVCFFAVEHAEL